MDDIFSGDASLCVLVALPPEVLMVAMPFQFRRITITPFLMSSVLLLIAMRHCTDVLFARLRHSLCIEIGGAMTADTPPQQIKEAA